MANGVSTRRILNWLIGTLVLMTAATPATAATLLIREEFGLSFFPGQEWTLIQNGPAAIYDLTGFGPGDPRFELRYAGDFFFLTALGNNQVANEPAALFGIDVYPGGVIPVSPAGLCGGPGAGGCYNGFGFVPWFDFPLLAGEFVSLFIPTGAVGEPAAWMLLIMAWLWLVWGASRGKPAPLTPR